MTKEKIVRIEVSGPDEFGFFLSTELGLSLTKWKPESVNSLLAPYVQQFRQTRVPL